MSTTALEPTIDLAALLERVDDDWGLVATLLELFDAQEPVLMAAMDAALSAGALGEAGRAAHGLASSLGTLAAMPAMRAAKEIECAARAGDLAAVTAARACLEACRKDLHGELRAVSARCTLHADSPGGFARVH